MRVAAAGSSVLPASGAHPRTPATTASRSNVSWITARCIEPRTRRLRIHPRLTMTDYEFTLKFTLPDSATDTDQCVEALAAAGCDDALVGVGQSGRIALNFTRTAKSAFEAVSTALRDVRKAIPEAVLVEASPDFVGLTDVAEIAGFTRQNMRKL